MNFTPIRSSHRTCNLIKKNSNTGVSCEYCKIFKSSYFEEHPPRAGFVQFNIVSDKSKTKNNAFKQNVLHKFVSHFLYKARNSKHQNAQMEEFSILLIKTKIIYLKPLETISYSKLRHQAIS